ncbi:MAG: hypothetical protein QM813_16545 [Verrucomicrobiota bacterium]
MSENQNQDFEKLQQLLKLKRYEQPHPRYFKDLSGQVTARLRAGETARLDNFEEAMTQAPWLQRLWAAIERRPALSGLVSAGMCGLLLVGGFLAGKPSFQPGLAANELGKKQSDVTNQSLLATTAAGTATFSSSTNPTAMMPRSSLFDLTPNIQTAPTSGRQIAP